MVNIMKYSFQNTLILIIALVIIRLSCLDVSAETNKALTDKSISSATRFEVNKTVAPEPDSIRMACKILNIGYHESVQLRPIIPDGTATTFKYSSRDKDVASVTKNGVVRGLLSGRRTVITVKTHNNKKFRLVVRVKKAPDNIKLDKNDAILNAGDNLQLKAILPNKSASQLTWKSDNTDIAEVNDNGVVTAKDGGSATITVSTFNSKIASCVVNVNVNAVSTASLSGFTYFCDRSNYGWQDIAIYNHKIYGFDPGYMYVDYHAYQIVNGHGNNCMFGNELHGNYPYLYCSSWNKDSCSIYVNQLTDTGTSLIRTITYPSLKGYLNCCVDEDNNRIFILLCTSETTPEGVVDFIISDLDGNILERKHIDNIPIIQGMTFHSGLIYVMSGFGSEQFPGIISVYDTKGNLIARNSDTGISGEFEGVDFDNDTMYLATGTTIYRRGLSDS